MKSYDRISGAMKRQRKVVVVLADIQFCRPALLNRVTAMSITQAVMATGAHQTASCESAQLPRPGLQ